MKHFARLAALATAIAVLSIGTQPARAAVRPVVPELSFESASAQGSAQAYCRSTGGTVENRTPVYGTNNSSSAGQLVLAGHADFCRYTKGTGSTSTSIHVLLTTLYATMPTLAALAYYAKVPLSKANCTGGGNPASCYCTYLGGSDQFGGTTLAGGAWVLKNAIDPDLEACIFPDLSSIDSFGILYHSNNTIRGIDLSKVLRYHKK